MPRQIKRWIYWLANFTFPALVFFITDNKVLAQGSPGGGGQPGSIQLPNPLGQGATFITIINNILNYLIYISIPILAIMILIGGFQILTARDNPEKITSGRKTIMYAVIGFTVILISKGVALILLRIIG